MPHGMSAPDVYRQVSCLPCNTNFLYWQLSKGGEMSWLKKMPMLGLKLNIKGKQCSLPDGKTSCLLIFPGHIFHSLKMNSTWYESESTSVCLNSIFCLKLLRTLLLTWMLARLLLLFIWIKVLQYNKHSPTFSIFEQGISSLRFLIPPSVFRCSYSTPWENRKQPILED